MMDRRRRRRHRAVLGVIVRSDRAPSDADDRRRRRRDSGGDDDVVVLFDALLLLHSTVLEPDLHLRLVEAEGGGNLDATGARQVPVEVEFLLQLRQLSVGEVGTTQLAGARRRLLNGGELTVLLDEVRTRTGVDVQWFTWA